MKIVFVVDSMNCGGTERVVSILTNYFVRYGHDITILFASTSNTSSFYPISDLVKRTTIIDKDRSVPKFFSRVRLLKKELCDLKPDVVISFLSHINVYTWLALRKTQIPYILCERNNPKMYSPIIRVLLRMAFKNSTGCVFQSKFAMKYYGKRVSKKAKVIYNPFDTRSFAPSISKSKTFSIISVGRLVSQKRFDLLIDSFEIFSKENADYTLHIYGDGPLKNELSNRIFEKRLTGKAFLEGATKDINKVFSKADMFVLCSDYEGMPNSLGEALLSGLPCIANDSFEGGTSELMNLFGLESHKFYNNPKVVSDLMQKYIEKYPNQNNRELLSESLICSQWINYCEAISNE